tara:strand:- start:27 stop:497 length:471 start_codon:yes stop_codon:yes gene_type:complete
MECLENVFISKGVISLSVIDFNVICHYLKNKSFKIHELLALRNHEEVSCLWKGEEPVWDDKIDVFLETCNDQITTYAKIEIKNGANLNFSYGRLTISNENQKTLKLFTLKILDFYGYFAALEIWNFCKNQKMEVNISSLIGIQSSEIDSHIKNLVK